MKYTVLVFLLIYSCNSHARWTELKYNTSSECFTTGIKRVFVPFPGFGTIACLKDAIVQLPHYEKSTHLLAGHATALVASSCICIVALAIGLNLGIPGCKQVLGADIAQHLKLHLPSNSVICK
jgi:hypothetical protein